MEDFIAHNLTQHTVMGLVGPGLPDGPVTTNTLLWEGAPQGPEPGRPDVPLCDGHS